MESGEITGRQIKASSQYNSNWSAGRSRLNYHENGWTPAQDSNKEWIQVCSSELRAVCGVLAPKSDQISHSALTEPADSELLLRK